MPSFTESADLRSDILSRLHALADEPVGNDRPDRVATACALLLEYLRGVVDAPDVAEALGRVMEEEGNGQVHITTEIEETEIHAAAGDRQPAHAQI